jgi:hypothetical protein
LSNGIGAGEGWAEAIMRAGLERFGLGGNLGDWSRVLTVLSIVASVAAAAWYLDDRGGAKVIREADGLERNLERLDTRLNQRMDEIASSVREVNQRLDRLLELQMARSEKR